MYICDIIPCEDVISHPVYMKFNTSCIDAISLNTDSKDYTIVQHGAIIFKVNKSN